MRIPVPKGVGLDDAKTLQSFFAWYARQVALHGPTYGTKREARVRRRKEKVSHK
jgi:hypothetical protein